MVNIGMRIQPSPSLFPTHRIWMAYKIDRLDVCVRSLRLETIEFLSGMPMGQAASLLVAEVDLGDIIKYMFPMWYYSGPVNFLKKHKETQ